jgi:hypothetical protein
MWPSITGSNFGVTRTNLLVRSEEFDNASWTKIRSTVSADATLAPNGTTTADKFIEDTTASDTHIVVQGASVTSGTTYVASFYLKAGERSSVYLSLSISFAGGTDALFNASTGVATSLGVTSCSMTPVGNGWYRCVATATANATGTGNFNLYSYNGSTIVYTGDGTSGIYLWGAQVEASSAVTPYIQSPSVFTSRASSGTYVGSDGLIKTATTDYLLRSEEFDNASWTKGANTIVTANYAVAPNGTTTADRVEMPNTIGTVVSQPATVVSGLTYTFSIYARATAATSAFLIQLGTNTASHVLTAQWQRYSLSFTATGSSLAAGLDNGNNATDFLVWGAQLEQSPSVGEYIPTTSAINSEARYDHDPVSLISKGLLLEDARTNLALDSEDFSAATWTLGAVTVTANAAVSPTGATTADSLLETTANTEHILYATATYTFTTATQSLYVKPNGRTNVALRFYYGINDWVARVFSLTGSGSVTQSSAGSSSGFSAVSSSIVDAGNGWYRISMTATQASRLVYVSSPDLCTSSTPTLAASNGTEVYAGDVTKGVYVWGAQLETASTASSYIPTTGSTVTRAADISTSVATSVFESSWYRQSEGTVFANGTSRSTSGGNAFVLQIDDGTSNNTLRVYHQTDEQAVFQVRTSATSRFSTGFGTLTDGTAYKASANFKSGDNAAVLNGGNITSNATTWTPSSAFTRLVIGNSQATEILNGHIRRLTYWPTRLGNEVLQRITQ